MSTTEELGSERPAEDADESQWKAFARKWEQRAKAKPSDEELEELRSKAARVDALEAAGQSELERLGARLEAAEKERDDLRADITARDEAKQRDVVLAEVAELKGVPASALRGSTREELESHADEILALLPAKPKAALDGSGGDRGDDIEAGDASAEQIAANIRI